VTRPFGPSSGSLPSYSSCSAASGLFGPDMEWPALHGHDALVACMWRHSRERAAITPGILDFGAQDLEQPTKASDLAPPDCCFCRPTIALCNPEEALAGPCAWDSQRADGLA
jgi:hypothetical protein